MSVAFAASDNECFVGFGERGTSVNQAGKVLEHFVAEGPYQDSEYGFINALDDSAWQYDAASGILRVVYGNDAGALQVLDCGGSR